MTIRCPHCGNEDKSLIEIIHGDTKTLYCVVCSKKFAVKE